jgi:predicted amidohydrolase
VGTTARAFPTRFGRMGLLICEDFWHVSPPYVLWLDGAEVLLCASASPGRGMQGEAGLESARWVESVGQAYARLFSVFVAQTNRVCLEDGLTFWAAASAGQRCLARAPARRLDAGRDRSVGGQPARSLPLLRDERPDLILRELDRLQC